MGGWAYNTFIYLKYNIILKNTTKLYNYYFKYDFLYFYTHNKPFLNDKYLYFLFYFI